MLSVALSMITWTMMILETKGDLINNVTAARLFLDTFNAEASRVFNRYSEASWTFNTNITEYNQKAMLKERLAADKFSQDAARNASQYNLTLLDASMKRQFIKIMDIGTAAQTNETKLIRLSQIESEMETIYSKATVCLTPEKCLPLDPDLTRIFSTSRDYNELVAAWKGWRDATGPKMKNLYAEFVTLSNEAVRILGHADTGAYWRSRYDTPEFEADVQALFDQLRPLYEHLHAYARRRLKAIYGKEKFPSTGHIPAHLLGNMWAQQWSSLVDEFVPYKGKPSLDVTPEMVRQNYTPEKIFRTADNFFQSLGMIPMPEPFWNKSMLSKPTDGRDVVCHASAWDFSNGIDFRVKQCTDITQEHLETAHHEMGHIEYYLQYKTQPLVFQEGANPDWVLENSPGRERKATLTKLGYDATTAIYSAVELNSFRTKQRTIDSLARPKNMFKSQFGIKQCSEVTHSDMIIIHHEMGHIEYDLQYRKLPFIFQRGANPGFHEAVGDVISLSVQTPEHMKSIGLLQTVSNDAETDINFLMSMALQKIAFLPFGFLIDQWRWRVFSGETKPEQYNEHWWNLRCRYQGVSSPVERSASDFDPGAKFHIPGNTPYIRYFVSFVVQFQFHKALCDISGYTGPLHRCDIYNSTAAGTALSKMLSLGSSKPWTDAMYVLTNQTKMDAQPLMDYFKPLLEYLRKENGNDYGWDPICPSLTPSSGKNHGSKISGLLTPLLISFYVFLVCFF